MFYQCYALRTIDLSHFSTENVTNFENMFYKCENVTTLDTKTFNTANATTLKNMFYNCSELVTIIASYDFVVPRGCDTGNMFYNDAKLVGGRGTRYRYGIDMVFGVVTKQ